MGLARRCYGDQPSYAGEVDHAELLTRLAGFDGWALSCSSASVPAIAALLVAQDLPARLAIWLRRPRSHATARVVTAYEGLFYSPARDVREPGAPQIADVFDTVPVARIRPTLPGAVIGMKPPAFCAWVFDLLGAAPWDTLADLFPGSGIVSRAWRQYTGDATFSPAGATFWREAELSRGSAGAASPRARADE